MAHKTMKSGTEYAITSGKTRVSGTEYTITSGKTRVSGTEYALPFVHPNGIGDLPVGTSVTFQVNGEDRNFIIVHHGLPSDMYDASCDGVWVMAKNTMSNIQFYSNGKNTYAVSTLHNDLNSTWIAKLDERVQNSILNVKIPYWDGDGVNGSLKTGANGLSTKVFAFSCMELGYGTADNRPNDGSPVQYFENATDADRIAYTYGSSPSARSQWTRTPVLGVTNKSITVGQDGRVQTNSSNSMSFTRPVFILPYDFEI